MRSIQVLIDGEFLTEIGLEEVEPLPADKVGDLAAERERLYRAINTIAYWVSEGDCDNVLIPLVTGDQP